MYVRFIGIPPAPTSFVSYNPPVPEWRSLCATQKLSIESIPRASCHRVGYLYLSRLLAVGTPAELKARPDVTPENARRLEIRGPESLQRIAGLRTEPGVREATIFGDAIHALVDRGYSTDGLVRQGMTVRDISTNLEDVFVTLSRAQSLSS